MFDEEYTYIYMDKKFFIVIIKDSRLQVNLVIAYAIFIQFYVIPELLF